MVISLLAYVAVGLMDSVHYRPLLKDRIRVADLPQRGVEPAGYGNEAIAIAFREKPIRRRSQRSLTPWKPWNIRDGDPYGNIRACFMAARIYANPANVPEILRARAGSCHARRIWVLAAAGDGILVVLAQAGRAVDAGNTQAGAWRG